MISAVLVTQYMGGGGSSQSRSPNPWPVFTGASCYVFAEAVVYIPSIVSAAGIVL